MSENDVGAIDFSIKIIDNGRGIDRKGIDKLFINFSRLDNGSQINPSGTGLGLGICKQLIEKMGGAIKVKSKIGEGTVFLIKLQTEIRLNADSEELKDDEVSKREINSLSESL